MLLSWNVFYPGGGNFFETDYTFRVPWAYTICSSQNWSLSAQPYLNSATHLSETNSFREGACACNWRNLENGTDLPNRCAKMGQKAHGAPQNKCQWQDAVSIDVFVAKNIKFCYWSPVQHLQIQVVTFIFWHNLVNFCVVVLNLFLVFR